MNKQVYHDYVAAEQAYSEATSAMLPVIYEFMLKFALLTRRKLNLNFVEVGGKVVTESYCHSWAREYSNTSRFEFEDCHIRFLDADYEVFRSWRLTEDMFEIGAAERFADAYVDALIGEHKARTEKEIKRRQEKIKELEDELAKLKGKQ